MNIYETKCNRKVRRERKESQVISWGNVQRSNCHDHNETISL